MTLREYTELLKRHDKENKELLIACIKEIIHMADKIGANRNAYFRTCIEIMDKVEKSTDLKNYILEEPK